jgi:hypothetical protein
MARDKDLAMWYHERYHEQVSNAARILRRMRANPQDWRIEDLKVVAERFSIDYRQHGTSHVVFRHPVAGLLTVPSARPIKPVYIRRFVALIDLVEGKQ